MPPSRQRLQSLRSSRLHPSLLASVAAASSAVRVGKTASIARLLHHHRVPSANLPRLQTSSHLSPLCRASSIVAVTHPHIAVVPSKVRKPRSSLQTAARSSKSTSRVLPRQSPLVASSFYLVAAAGLPRE
ncbi:uncharacterized protein DS421_4g115990 [Arachis hypogaea]|nr:uncharacterized protein DS421_4g115990 [Arachis hypogaea]